MKKRTIYKDGWHDQKNGFMFLVENGRLIRGVDLERGIPLYPYKPSKYSGLDNISGIKARYGILREIYWR